MKIITMIISLCLFVSLSSLSYALSCNQRNWTNTKEYWEDTKDWAHKAENKYANACSYGGSDITKSNYEETIEDIDSRIEKLYDAIDDFKQAEKLLSTVEERWYSLHEECDGKASDDAYSNYKNASIDTDFVDKVKQCQKELEELKSKLIGRFQDDLSFDDDYNAEELERIAEESERRILELEHAKAGEMKRNYQIKMYQSIKGYAPKRMAVNVEIANLYSGPGTNYELQWQAEKYFSVLIFSKKDNWYKIMDAQGDFAWIDKSFLGEINSIVTTSTCLTNDCFVRSLPNKDSQALFSVFNGIPFKVLSHNGDWLKIEHSDGSVGWIYNGYVW